VFEWTVTGLSDVAFSCTFNDGPPFACESGYTVPAANLSDGSNVLMVTGSSGDLTLGPLELTFTKATTPPASVMLQGSVEGESLVFTWTGPDNAVYKCVLDNQEQFDCASGYKLAFSEAGAGEHTFVVKAIVSSQEVASGTATFTVPTPPPPSVAVDLSAAIEGQELAFSWTPASGAVYRCTLDGGEEFDCSSGYKLSFSDAGAGDHGHQPVVLCTDVHWTMDKSLIAHLVTSCPSVMQEQVNILL
jgi:hypothetical protein